MIADSVLCEVVFSVGEADRATACEGGWMVLLLVSGKVLEEDSNVHNKFFMAWGLHLDSKFVGVSAEELFSENSPYAVPIFTYFV